MKIQCPQCGVQGSADKSYHGQKVKCPKCQAVFAALPLMPQTPVADVLPTATHVGNSAELSVPISHVLPEYAQKIPALPVDVAVAPVAVDSGLPSHTLGDILAADIATGNDQSPLAASAKPVVEQQDALKDDLELQDVVLAMDRDKAEASKPGKDADWDSVNLHDFFEPSGSPVNDVPLSVVQQENEEPPDVNAVASDEPLAILGDEEPGAPKNALDGVEDQPYGMDKAQCWQCGKKDSVGVPFIAKDGRLYCSACLPPEKEEHHALPAIPQVSTRVEGGRTVAPPLEPKYSFTIGGLLKEAWAKTSGAKATVWVGSAVMYLALILIVTGCTFLLPSQGNLHVPSMVGILEGFLCQMIFIVVLVIFSAGLIFIGIRKVAGDAIHWKMVFEGFPVAGKLIVATILQSLLVFIGFLLLILPGIYLAIGYAMTVPLIVDRKMSPWQAMEASRKAIHVEWWKIFGLFLAMGLIFLISSLPFGLGLIWTWPMFVILGGVVYRSLFGIAKKVEY